MPTTQGLTWSHASELKVHFITSGRPWLTLVHTTLSWYPQLYAPIAPGTSTYTAASTTYPASESSTIIYSLSSTPD